MSVARRKNGAGAWRWLAAGGVAAGLVVPWMFRQEEPVEKKRAERAPAGGSAMSRGDAAAVAEDAIRPEAGPRTVPRQQPAGTGAGATGEVAVPELEAYLSMPGLTVEERVTALQSLRGKSLSNQERERAMGFLAGKGRQVELTRGATHWLADELLTILRMQQAPWEGLAAALAGVAFQPEIDPMIRDYITQHLGHLWEQHGWTEEIEVALWKAVESRDETTPGSALIALHRGYQREEQTQGLARVAERSLEIAKNPSIPLASRVTALAIAGEDGGSGAKELAGDLVTQAETPVLLRKVAENVLAR